VAATTRGRLVRVNQTVIDQADYFQADGFTRVAGLTIVDVEAQVFFDNVLQPWPLTDGSTVADNQVASGRLYFHEITGTTGNYSLRFRPNAGGYWRVLLTYPTGQQILAQDYDVTAEPLTVKGGIKASFNNC
jgi:hypothetical protein